MGRLDCRRRAIISPATRVLTRVKLTGISTAKRAGNKGCQEIKGVAHSAVPTKEVNLSIAAGRSCTLCLSLSLCRPRRRC